MLSENIQLGKRKADYIFTKSFMYLISIYNMNVKIGPMTTEAIYSGPNLQSCSISILWESRVFLIQNVYRHVVAHKGIREAKTLSMSILLYISLILITKALWRLRERIVDSINIPTSPYTPPKKVTLDSTSLHCSWRYPCFLCCNRHECIRGIKSWTYSIISMSALSENDSRNGNICWDRFYGVQNHVTC